MIIQGPAIDAEFVIEGGIIQDIHMSLSSTPGLKWCIRSSRPHVALEQMIYDWFTSYTQKKPIEMQWPLNWAKLTPFTRQTLTTLMQVPFGTSLSYKDLAKILGKEQASRAVGSACGRNPFLLIVPCHRVLTSNKTLGGFSAGLELKRRLLSFENIPYLS